MREMKYVEALREALRAEMIADERVYLIGESLGPMQDGIYKVTAGLQQQFGKERVIDTPISEAAIAGSSVGAAMFGMRPVCEIMFGNLMALVGDEFHNQAGKFFYVSGGKARVPMVLRTATWQRIVSGPHHCGSLDVWMMNSPGLKVVTPATPQDAYSLLRAAIRDDDPVVFIEHNMLYPTKGIVDESIETLPIGCANVVREGTDVSVIAYSITVLDALAAAAEMEKRGVSVEVLDLRTIKPLDEAAIYRTARKTGRVVVAYEGYKTAGAGAEISALIAENAIDYMAAPIVRVANPDVPQAANQLMIDRVSVSAKAIVEGILKTLD